VSEKREMPEEEPLNLVPIMNLVTILIPVLLMAIKSVDYVIISTELPAVGGGAPPEATDKEPPLALKMAITNKGIRLLGADNYLYPSGRPEAGPDAIPDIPCKSKGICSGLDDYDWTALSEKLYDIKKQAQADDRDSDSVVFLSESNIKYEVLVSAMDASRSYKTPGGTPEKLFPILQIAGGAK